MKNLLGVICTLAWVLATLPSPVAARDDDYSPADLDQMLAPIALYPDSVLSHILIASTYPLEVVQAARWSRQHPDLKGEQAVDAVEDKSWDPSVKALVAFPEILARMDEDLEWTEELGDAFLAQEGELMDRVQHLRQRAYDAGNLNALEHTRVIREREVIYIEPALRHIIYLPYYDPWVVYGSWWWPAYPPHHWTYWAGRPVRYYGSGFHWGIGFHVAPVFYFSGFHWHNRHVVVIPAHRHRHSSWSGSSHELARHSDARRWQHDVRHRRGVEYRSARLSRYYGRSAPVRDNQRREREAQQRENPGSRRAGPHSEPRKATVPSDRAEYRRRSASSTGPDAPRVREQPAQTPQREPAQEQESSRAESGAVRNSRRETAPAARGHGSERADPAPRRNSRGEDGRRDPRQRRHEH